MNNLIIQDIEESVAILAVEKVMSRVATELDRLGRAQELYDVSWFSQMMDVLQFCASAEIGFSHAKAYALSILHARWDEVEPDIKKQFGFTFYNFAKMITGKELSTVDNYIRTARVWLGPNRIKPLGKIRVPIREPNGKHKKDEQGKPAYKYVEWNPYSIDMSKLLFLNSRAAKGEMTERFWELLVDPKVTCEDIRIEAAGGKESEEDLSLKFMLIGPGLYASENGDIVCIAEELSWESYYNEEPGNLTQKAIRYLLGILNIPDPDDQIAEMYRKTLIVEGEKREKK